MNDYSIKGILPSFWYLEELLLSRSSQVHMARALMASLSLNSSIGTLVRQAAAILQNAALLPDPACRLIAMENLGGEINDILQQDCPENRRISDEHILLIKDAGLTRDPEQSSSVPLWQDQDCVNSIPRLAQKINSPEHVCLGQSPSCSPGGRLPPRSAFSWRRLWRPSHRRWPIMNT